jgi:hypothetical protein
MSLASINSPKINQIIQPFTWVSLMLSLSSFKGEVFQNGVAAISIRVDKPDEDAFKVTVLRRASKQCYHILPPFL